MLAGVVYQAPDLCSVINSRLVSYITTQLNLVNPINQSVNQSINQSINQSTIIIIIDLMSVNQSGINQSMIPVHNSLEGFWGSDSPRRAFTVPSMWLNCYFPKAFTDNRVFPSGKPVFQIREGSQVKNPTRSAS